MSGRPLVVGLPFRWGSRRFKSAEAIYADDPLYERLSRHFPVCVREATDAEMPLLQRSLKATPTPPVHDYLADDPEDYLL